MAITSFNAGEAVAVALITLVLLLWLIDLTRPS
jgi:hypothetical protein